VGRWLPPSPILVKCRLRQHLANPLVNQGPYLVKRDPTVRPIYTALRTRSLLGGVAVLAGAAQSPPGRGGGVNPVAPDPGDGGGGGVLALEVALVLELGFPPNLDLVVVVASLSKYVADV
jgi:hypothetical protein